MSATKGEREQHGKPDGAVDGLHRPYWKRAHHSVFFWVAAFAILTAMVIYVTSINLALGPRGRAQPQSPAGIAP